MEYFKKIFLILLSFIILFIIYSSFSTNNHLSYGQDALLYSYWKDNGLIAGTGRNLLWSVSFFYFYKIFNFLALSGGALRAGQILSSLFSAGNVILFYFILEKFFINKKDYLLGIVFTCFYAFSFSHWHLSGEVTYAAFTSFFILILLLLIIRTDKDISLKKAFLFGILFAVVPLSRYPSFILLPVFGAIVYFSAKKLPGLKLVLSCIVSIIIFYILYLCLSNILGHGPQFIIETHKYIFQILAKKSGIGVKLTLDKIPIGILYLLKSTLFIEGLRSPSMFFQEIIKFKNIITPINIVFVVFLLTSFFIGIKHRKELSHKKKVLILACFLWFIIYAGAILYDEYWRLEGYVIALPAIWISVFIIWQHFFSSVTNTKIFRITVITLIVVLSLFIYQNFALGIYPSSKDSAFETLPYYAKINNLAKAGDSILLVSDMKNFEAYELEYLLKHRYADKKYNLFLIDMPGRNRSFFEDYRYVLRHDIPDYIYMLIIPKQNLFNIKNMGDVKKLKDMLGNFFTDTPLEKKAPMLDMAKDFIILYDKYISIEVEGLNCNLFKLIREKQKA